MDWIHCNLCYNQPKNSSPGFVLTSCGHIFCENCESRENVDQCKSCKSRCSVAKLTANMSTEVRPYFEDTEESAKRLLQTIRFQKNHRFNLFKTYKRIVVKESSCEGAERKNYERGSVGCGVSLFHNEKYLTAKNYIRKLEVQNSSLKRKLEQYSKSKAMVTPRVSEFLFTPDINRKHTPVFNTYASSQNSSQSGKPNFLFRLPDIHAYQQYRNEVQSTPVMSPAASTPRSDSMNIHQKKIQTPLRGQSKFPLRTPPFNDFQGMRITCQNY